MEGINAEMMKENIPFDTRLSKLKQVAVDQLKTLDRVNEFYSLRKNKEGQFQPFSTGMFPADPIKSGLPGIDS